MFKVSRKPTIFISLTKSLCSIASELDFSYKYLVTAMLVLFLCYINRYPS